MEVGAVVAVKPVVKWAGGKSWLARDLSGMKLEFVRWVEPFAGGASMLFSLEPARSSINDVNWHLISTLRTIRDDSLELHRSLSFIPVDVDTHRALSTANPTSEFDAAVRFIYLNRTSFGGIWRENRKGQFNVPFDRNANSKLPSIEEFQLAARVLKETCISHGDFADAMMDCGEGDFVYCDPPYGRCGPELLFNRYTGASFSLACHRRLSVAILEVLERGGKAMISLGGDASVLDVYSGVAQQVLYKSRKAGLGYKGNPRPIREELLVLCGFSEVDTRAFERVGWKIYG